MHASSSGPTPLAGVPVAPPVLTVVGACKTFGKTRALDGAELALRQGECLGLLGPNGAGKTTLIRAIAGRVRLDDGAISLPGRGRTLGLVPQEVALFPLLTARENLEAFGTFCGLRGAALQKQVEWALRWTDLGERAAEPIKRFSGGMKRRLNIACGVLHEPEVVLLDEPTLAVDPQSRQRIWEMLGELRKAGASLLLTTHQLDEAQQVCDRIVIIDRGRAVAEGTLAELIARTVGPGRWVTMVLEGPPPDVLRARGFEWDGPSTVRYRVAQPAAELPGLLAAVEAAGAQIRDLKIETPGLQSVFLHLTGRELRE